MPGVGLSVRIVFFLFFFFPACPWQCLLSRPAERCCRMCREPGLLSDLCVPYGRVPQDGAGR
eukprot:3668277-Prymnesium_polylepis.1